MNKSFFMDVIWWCLIKKKNQVSVECATCGNFEYGRKVEIPEGYSLECDRCTAGSPGKPRKQVRHCALCRLPIIVMGVSGSIRLTCGACATKDPKFIEIEALMKDRDKWRLKANDMVESRADVETRFERLQDAVAKERANINAEMEARIQKVETVNLELRKQIAEKEDQGLAERIKYKLDARYGEAAIKDYLDFLDFLEWFKRDDLAGDNEARDLAVRFMEERRCGGS